jgi:hypothetical protein
MQGCNDANGFSRDGRLGLSRLSFLNPGFRYTQVLLYGQTIKLLEQS